MCLIYLNKLIIPFKVVLNNTYYQSIITFAVGIFMELDLNILMIFGIKYKYIILTHAMHRWLFLQIYP